MKKSPKSIEELLRTHEEMLRSSRQAWQEFLRRPIFEPQPTPNWLEILGFLILAFLGRCFAVGFFVYLGCSLFLIIMAFFSSHADVLFRIGFPAAEKAAIYLSVVGGVVWSAIDVCRDFVQAKRQRNFQSREEEDDDDLEEEEDDDASRREIDLHPDVAEYLRQYTAGKSGLLFHTAKGTPHLYHNLEEHWLTSRLGLDEKGMGWHSFKRFRKTWLRGQRCLEDINNFWMAHKPKTMSEVYSHLHEELEMRLEEAERVGYGFAIPKAVVVPSVPRFSGPASIEIAA